MKKVTSDHNLSKLYNIYKIKKSSIPPAVSEEGCVSLQKPNRLQVEVSSAGTLWRIDLDEMLQFGGKACEWAAMVSFHVRVDAAVTEDKARRGQRRGVRTQPPTQRAAPDVGPQLSVLLQVERGRGRRHGGEGLHCALIF